MGLDRPALGILAGACLAIGFGAVSSETAAAARQGRTGLRVVAVNVRDLGQVALNQIIEIRFSAPIAPASLTDGSIKIVPYDTLTGEVGEARPGRFERHGRAVWFLPALPTHARDPESPDGDFYAFGSPGDDAFANGGLRPGVDYAVRIGGRDAAPAVTSTRRSTLRRTEFVPFRTVEANTEGALYVTETYAGTPPPVVRFTNPPDLASPSYDVYASPGGTPGVPPDARVTLFLNDVPLDPTTVRAAGAVELIRVAVAGAVTAPEPVAGDALVEQDRDTSRLIFRPAAPLDPESTYVLQIDAGVTDLTGAFDMADDAARLRLRDIYDWLVTARNLSPGVPPEQLPDPPSAQIPEWPVDQAERGVLKRNLLDLGDTHPWEIDPRVHAIFTTRAAISGTDPDPFVAKAGGTRHRPRAHVSDLVTPLGLQGVAGAGAGVVLPFRLSDPAGRPAQVEAQFGRDLDGDGRIDEDEFGPITIDVLDPRTTGRLDAAGRRARPGTSFATAPGGGRQVALVWNSPADTGALALPAVPQIVRTPQGRVVFDPGQPGTPLLDPALGVVVRLRTVQGRSRADDWIATEPFPIVNVHGPSLSIDQVTPGATTFIAWTAIHIDSEDWNGNHVLDPLQLEDLNGNGVLDSVAVGVAFDFHVLLPGEDPAATTRDELSALEWLPCTRDGGAGDPDDALPTAPLGYDYTFAWDAATDGADTGASLILRARPYDEHRQLGAWVYDTAEFAIGD